MKKKNRALRNEAFVDGQNLFLGTVNAKESWRVDLGRFREYLRAKYQVGKAYYFLGCEDGRYQKMYDSIRDAGFELVFRMHNEGSASNKKGNVDTDIVFTMMRDFHEEMKVEKFFLVSGDGDYYKTVKYLCEKEKLGRVLFPARRSASVLYKKLGCSFFDYLDCPDIKKKIKLK